MSKDSVFPTAVAAVTGAVPYPWGRALPLAALALFAAVLRRPDAFLTPQFWAEDGSVFFVQAEGLGLDALGFPHAGYHMFAMRLWAGFMAGLEVPVAWLPGLYVAGASAAWLAVALLLFSPRVRVRWPVAMLAALVMVPPANETWFNLTNMQWVLALLWPLWWVADDARTKSGIAFETAAMLVAGLTGVFSILAAPLMVFRAVRRRSPASIIAATACGVTALVQLGTLLADPAASPLASGSKGLDWGAAFLIFGKRIWGTLFVPVGAGGAAMSLVGLALAAAMLGGWAWNLWRTVRLRPLWGWVCFGGLMVAATVVRFRSDLGPLNGFFNGERYFFVPQMLVVWGLIQYAADGVRLWRWTARGFLAIALAIAMSRFRLPPLPDYDWPAWAARIEAGENIGWIPITPEGMRFYYRGRPQR